ncbi:MAG TPA: hypothetical protein VFK36_02115, partial [Gemmatimonadales bacterium]|nr:hypothetical protein [Gemmatimonadales bacterium]
ATVSPADYVAEHGANMPGFTYDEESYADPALDTWIVEVGRLLREAREAPAAAPVKPKPKAKPPKAEPKADA